MKIIRRIFLSLCLFFLLLFATACSESEVPATDQGSADPQVTQASQAAAAAVDPVRPAVTLEPAKTKTPEPSATPAPEKIDSLPPEQATAPAVEEAQEVVEDAAPADFSDGFACLGTTGQGISCLAGNGVWKNFSSDNSPLGGDFVTDIDTCDDGTMLILHGSGVSSFDGQRWREYPPGWGFGSTAAIACTGTGEFWVAHFEGVSYFEKGDWRNFDAQELAFGDEATDLVRDVAVDEAGNAWVVTANSIAFYNGLEWTVYQVDQGFSDKYFFDAIALSSDGTPWVAHSNGLLSYESGNWEIHENRNIYNLQDVAVDRDGIKWVGTFGQGIALFDGAVWEVRDRFSGDLDSDNINKIKIDESGRVWVATGFGLHVYDGQAWHIYRMENAGLIENSIQTIGVSGHPKLAQQVEKEPGSLSGSVTKDGRPYAGAAVEICVEPIGSFYGGDTPCGGQPFVRAAITDEGGSFTFGDLPAGYYVIAVGNDDGWAQLTSAYGVGNERVLVSPGQDTAVGELTVTPDA